MKDVRIEDILVHDRFVRRLALQLMGDAATADDVTQEVYLKALGRGPKEGGSIRGWLATVLRNIGANVRRGGQRRVERERRASRPESVRETESTIVEREELRRRLVAAILDLGKPRSTILLLRYFEGVSPRGIAARLEMPVETVRTHLKRSLVLLRSRLESETGPGGTSLLGALPLLVPATRGLATSIGILMTAKTKIALASVCVLVAVGIWIAPPFAKWGADLARGGSAASTPGQDHGSGTASGRPGLPAITPRRVAEDVAESRAANAIEGVVVDSSGKGIGGARVVASDAGAPITISATESRSAAAPSPSAVADAAGRFKIDLEPPARLLTLCATAPGFSPAVRTPVGFGQRHTLVLEAPLTFIGRTLDTSGKPVGGARVRWSSDPRGIGFAAEAVSGEDGRYRIADVPSGELARSMTWGMMLEARAEGFAPVTIFAARNTYREGVTRTVPMTPGAVIERDLILARGVRVQGRLAEAETGSPIANVTVMFRSWVSANVLRDTGLARGEERSTRSDADGRYAFEALPSLGFHVLGSRVAGNPVGLVRAKPDGFALIEVQVPESPEGAVLDLDLAGWRTARVRGRVVDSTGVPQGGVEVWSYVRSLGGAQVRQVTTGADGRFVVEAIPARSSEPTPVSISAIPADSDSMPQMGVPSVRREVSLRAGDDVEIEDLMLDALPSVRLRVVDPSGLPIQGATVRAGWQGWIPPTDRDGRCTVAFAPDALGRRRLVRVWANGFGSVAVEDLVPAVKPAESTVVLRPGRRLRGRLLWSDRTPARGIEVVLTEGRAPREIAAMDAPSEADFYRFHRVRIASAEDGRFDFVDLLEGPYWVGAGFGSRTETNGPSEPQVLMKDVRDPEIEIVLPPDPAVESLRDNKGVVEGTVTSAVTKGAVVSVTTYLTRAGARLAGGAPTLGQYRIEDVPPGKWLLCVESPGFVTFKREIEVGPLPLRVDVVLSEGLSIFGNISVAKSSRLAEIQVFFTKADGEPGIAAKIAADGSYRAAGLTPGRYFIYVGYPNAGQWDKALAATGPLLVTLDSGSPSVRRDIEVVRGGWLGVGIESKLDPKSHAILSVLDASGRLSYELDLIGGCSGASMALPEGTYRVRLSVGGTVIATAEATVVDGTPARVTLK